MNTPTIGIVIPCFNESDVINDSYKLISGAINRLIKQKLISEKSFIGFVDDGSTDETWFKIEQLSLLNKNVKGLKLSKNVGHQNALLAGLLTYNKTSDALISIDADMQDDISVMESMIEKYITGNQVVYAVRKERKTDSFFKRNTALMFYKLMKFMCVNIIYNHADYRLYSSTIINALNEYKEANLFLRGIIPDIGFKSDIVYYDRAERLAGKSKYSLSKMISFAWDGITSFSNYPLKLVTLLSFIVFIICILMSIYAVISLYYRSVVPGWFSTVLPMYFLGGVQLFSLGIIGEYIGKIYKETKHRPRYFIEKMID